MGLFDEMLDRIAGGREAYQRMFPDADLALAMVRARAERGQEQEQFARSLGISLDALVRIESGNLGLYAGERVATSRQSTPLVDDFSELYVDLGGEA